MLLLNSLFERISQNVKVAKSHGGSPSYDSTWKRRSIITGVYVGSLPKNDLLMAWAVNKERHQKLLLRVPKPHTYCQSISRWVCFKYLPVRQVHLYSHSRWTCYPPNGLVCVSPVSREIEWCVISWWQRMRRNQVVVTVLDSRKYLPKRKKRGKNGASFPIAEFGQSRTADNSLAATPSCLMGYETANQMVGEAWRI